MAQYIQRQDLYIYLKFFNGRKYDARFAIYRYTYNLIILQKIVKVFSYFCFFLRTHNIQRENHI